MTVWTASSVTFHGDYDERGGWLLNSFLSTCIPNFICGENGKFLFNCFRKEKKTSSSQISTTSKQPLRLHACYTRIRYLIWKTDFRTKLICHWKLQFESWLAHRQNKIGEWMQQSEKKGKEDHRTNFPEFFNPHVKILPTLFVFPDSFSLLFSFFVFI